MPRSRWVVGVAMAMAVASCAGLPTAGSVHVGRPVPGIVGFDSRDQKIFPAGPQPGQTRTAIVTSYLDALVDSDNNYAVARSFLAPGTRWNPSSGITLYDRSSAVVTRGRGNFVDVRFNRVGIIDGQGSYRVLPGVVDVPFRLLHRSGEWRIAHLPAGVLLSTSDARRSLQPADLFYLNATQTHLVPAPILVLPDQPGLATLLVRSLLDGPSRELAPAVLTGAPNGLSLVGNVPIDSSGVAEVNLSGGVQQISAGQLQRLSAQIVWTLRQIRTVTAVRLLENGTSLSDVGVPAVQPIDSWGQFNPEIAPAIRGVLLSRAGHVIARNGAVPSAVDHHAITAPRLSANGSVVAGLRQARGRVSLVAGPAAGPLRPRLTGPRLSVPSFDPLGNVFVVRGSGAQSSIIEVPTQGSARPVSLPADLRGAGVSAIAISRDGSRAALVVGPPGHAALFVSAFSEAHGAPVISGDAVVLQPTEAVSGLAWAGSNRIATTVRRGPGQRAVVLTSVDGYRPHTVSSIGLPANPTQVAAAPGQPLLAGAGGGVYSLSNRAWTRVSSGRDPSYAG